MWKYAIYKTQDKQRPSPWTKSDGRRFGESLTHFLGVVIDTDI